MASPRVRRFQNEITSYFREHSIPLPTEIPQITEESCDMCFNICALLPSHRLRITFLDRLIRRKAVVLPDQSDYIKGLCVLLSQFVNPSIVFTFLTKEFHAVHRLYNSASAASSSIDLCQCMQLMSHCLTHISQSNDELEVCIADIFTCVASCDVFTSMDCLNAGYTLMVRILYHYAGDAFSENLRICLHANTSGSSQKIPPHFEPVMKLLSHRHGEALQVQQLAFLHALIGSVSWNVENKNTDDDDNNSLPFVLLKHAFPSRVGQTQWTSSNLATPVLVYLAKIGQLWSARLRKSTMSTNGATPRIDHLLQQSVKDLLHFSLDLKSSPIPVVRHCCGDTVANLIGSHVAYCQGCLDAVEVCATVQKMLNHVASSVWFTRGTLVMLHRILATLFQLTEYHVGSLLPIMSSDSLSRELDDSCRTVGARLLTCSSNTSLATHVSDLYALIAVRMKTTDPTLLNVWFDALLKCASENVGSFGVGVSQHILPKLATSNYSLLLELTRYSHSAHNSSCIPLQLACYRLIAQSGQKKNKKKGIIGMEQVPRCDELLRTALTCSDLRLRLDSMDLLCALILACKDANRIEQLFALFIEFLEANCWIHSRPVRREIVFSLYTVMKHLLKSQTKPLGLGVEKVTLVGGHTETLSIKIAIVFLRCLYPGAPAARLSFGLAGLYNLMMALKTSLQNTATIESTDPLQLFSIALSWTNDPRLDSVAYSQLYLSQPASSLADHTDRQLSARLYVGLCSQYEVDREYALQLFLTIGLAQRLPSDLSTQLWSDALQMLCCHTKPNVNPIGWHVLRLAINACPKPSPSCTLANTVPHLVLSDPRAARARSAVDELLLMLEQQVHVAESKGTEGLFAVSAKRPFYAMLSSIRAVLGNPSSQSECVDWSKLSESDVMSMLGQHGIFRSDVILSASDLFDPASHKDNPTTGPSLVHRLIHIALRISEVILPILAHESPEGYLPVEDEDDGADEYGGTFAEEDDDLRSSANETRKLPEYLTICCWRSVRELSLLLGVSLPGLNTTMPVDRTETEPTKTENRLSCDELLQIGEFFCQQLLCGRHRGSVEQCSSGFLPFCVTLLKSTEEQLATLPVLWLQSVLSTLLDDHVSVTVNCSESDEWYHRAQCLPLKCLQRNEESFCVTRRSAGLPLFIQTILTALWSTSGAVDRSEAANAVARLLDSIERTLQTDPTNLEISDSPDNLLSNQRCIVSLNITRTLMRCAGLMQPTASLIERASCLALDGLGHPDWAIRSSSSLLFSTLVERVFGTNRSRDASSRNNCLSSTTFFTRYPTLKEHIVRIFQSSCDTISVPGTDRAKLYAALFILTRLLPPNQISGLTDSLENALGPFVIRFAASCDIRIRRSAARALVCLIQTHRLPTLIRSYIVRLEQLISQPALISSSGRANLCHGLLYQLQELFHIYTVDDETRTNMTSRLQLLHLFSQSLSTLGNPSSCPCPLIRKVYLTISAQAKPPPLPPSVASAQGLDWEATSTHLNQWISWQVGLRINAPATVVALDCGPLQHKPDVLTLTGYLRNSDSLQLQTDALRQTMHHVANDITATTVGPLSGESANCAIDDPLHRIWTMNPARYQQVADWVDLKDLFDFILVEATHIGQMRSTMNRYGLALIATLLPSSQGWVDKSTFHRFTVWFYSFFDSDKKQTGITMHCLPIAIRLASRLANQLISSHPTEVTELQGQIDTLLGHCLIQLWSLPEGMLHHDLTCSLMSAFTELYHPLLVGWNTKNTRGILELLIQSLWDCESVDLQQLASDAVCIILQMPQSKSNGVHAPPLPFILLPRLAWHLHNSSLLTRTELFDMAARLSVGHYGQSSLKTETTRVFTPHHASTEIDSVTMLTSVFRAPLSTEKPIADPLAAAAADELRKALDDIEIPWFGSLDMVIKSCEIQRQFVRELTHQYGRFISH